MHPPKKAGKASARSAYMRLKYSKEEAELLGISSKSWD